MPVLQRISRDTGVPVLYLSYDSQTSDTGLDTRLEAFYDMIAMKKETARRRRPTARTAHTTANASEALPRARSGRTHCYLRVVFIGSISTQGVTSSTPTGASSRARTCGPRATRPMPRAAWWPTWGSQVDRDAVRVRAVGTTGSARRLRSAMRAPPLVKNEITAHAVGTHVFPHPDVRTILEHRRPGLENHLRGERHRRGRTP